MSVLLYCVLTKRVCNSQDGRVVRSQSSSLGVSSNLTSDNRIYQFNRLTSVFLICPIKKRLHSMSACVIVILRRPSINDTNKSFT